VFMVVIKNCDELEAEVKKKPWGEEDEVWSRSDTSSTSPFTGYGSAAGDPLGTSSRISTRSFPNGMGNVRIVTESGTESGTVPEKRLSFKWVDDKASESSAEHLDSEQEHLDISEMIDNEMVVAITRESEGRGFSVSLAVELEMVLFALQDDARRRDSMGTTSKVDLMGMDDDFKPGRQPPGMSNSVRRLPVRSHVLDTVTSIVGHRGGELHQKHFVLPRVCKQIFDFNIAVKPAEDVATRLMTGSLRLSSLGWLSQRFTCHRVLQSVARRIVENAFFSLFFFILTFYALFVPDFVSAFGSKDVDLPFSIVNTLVWGCFLVELGLYAFGVKGYGCTMAFVLDLVSLVSFLSDTWFFQGNVFGTQVTRVTRYARSARIVRLVRLVRVLRVTRFLPEVLALSGLKRNDVRLARALLARRLSRIFKFLDSDGDGRIAMFDFHIMYVCLLLELAHPDDCLSFEKRLTARMDILKADSAKLVDQHVQGRRGHTLEAQEFCQTFLATGLGKVMRKNHFVEVKGGDSGWVLTQRFSDAISLKVCVGLLLIVFMMEVLDTTDVNQGPAVALSQLAVLAERTHMHDIEFLCSRVNEYVRLYSGLFIFLWNATFFDLDHAVGCESSVPVTESDPFQRVSSIINTRDVREEYLEQICFPSSEYDEDSHCKVQASGVALIDVEESVRDESLVDIELTVLVISCLCLWLLLFNRSVTSFAQSLLKPLRALVDDMKAMTSLELVHIDAEAKQGELDEVKKPWLAPTRSASTEELLHLELSFRRLRTSIRSWARYVPPAVVQRLFSAGIEATLGVKRSLCSILFCDIDGFEEACESYNPEEVLRLLTKVFTAIGEVIQREGGTLLEFIGDEVLAVFNAPSRLKNHSYHAARSALEIHKAIRGLHLVVGGVNVRCRCGVHSAQVLAGNVGSRRRMKYGLLGDGVNLTARMKGLNSRYDTQTLASAEVVADMIVRENLISRPIDKVAVKGRAEATIVHELLALNKSQTALTSVLRAAARMHADAFALYFDRHFIEAADKFEDVRTLMLQANRDADEPSRQFKARCAALIRNPPGDTWDGVERLKSKTFSVSVEADADKLPTQDLSIENRALSTRVSAKTPVVRQNSDSVIGNLERVRSAWVDFEALQSTCDWSPECSLCSCLPHVASEDQERRPADCTSARVTPERTLDCRVNAV